ncbi:MAG TPA: chemotaxis protein CheW [Negativicutes bacterium]|nr:chemotaxis protein CheW [Negativicutes bacterium]
MADDVQLVIFKLAKEDYGLPISKVQEINRMVPITKLPNTPEFMEGIINLRGRVIPVLDLRKRFDFGFQDFTDDTRIMVTDISGQTVGLIVDAVNEVAKIAGECIEPPPPAFVLNAH